MENKAKIQKKIDFYMNKLSEQYLDGFYGKIVELVELAENKEELTIQERKNLILNYSIFENFYSLIQQIMIEENITPTTNDTLEFLSKIFPNIEITDWYQNKLFSQLRE